MGIVKTYSEFINEYFSKEQGLRDIYNNDQVFRRRVDSGRLDVDTDGYGYSKEDEKTIKPKDGEVFYGLINIVDKDLNKETLKIEFYCLTSNPKKLTGEINKKELVDLVEAYRDKHPTNWINPFVNHTSKKGYEETMIYAKVSVSQGKTKDYVYVSNVLKVYENREECENDMIETLKRK